MGFPFSHHSFHYRYYFYSVVDFSFSLIFSFQCLILSQGLFSCFSLEGEPIGKHGAARGNVTFGNGHAPTSRNVLTHSWIFCCSGTYDYVIPRVTCGLWFVCVAVSCCRAASHKGLGADFTLLLSPSASFV